MFAMADESVPIEKKRKEKKRRLVITKLNRREFSTSIKFTGQVVKKKSEKAITARKSGSRGTP